MAWKNKEQEREYNRKWYQRNNTGKDWRADRWYRAKYGITLDQFRHMELLQDGKCAACKQVPRGKGCAAVLNVDHNHATGRVRGLLCNPCNQALGLLGESAERVNGLLKYLEVA